MPVGLTTQLREDEFVDLVRFMVELGKEGKFKTSTQRFARQWEVLPRNSPNPGTIHHYGAKMFTQEFSGYKWKPFYAMVGGGIPFEEVPVALDRRGDKYQVLRTQVDAVKEGTHKVRLRGNLGDLNLFLGDQEVDFPNDGNQADLLINFKNAGKQELLMVVNGRDTKGYFALESLSDDLRVINTL